VLRCRAQAGLLGKLTLKVPWKNLGRCGAAQGARFGSF
jgi:hypothetical protein